MPAAGHGPHRYAFRLYALGDELELEPGADRAELERAIASALASAEVTGTYER